MILADDFVLQRALDQGWLSHAQCQSAQDAMALQVDAPSAASRLIDKLVADGALTAWQVASLRAEEFGLKTVDLAAVRVVEEVLALVPRALAERYRLLPLSRTDGGLCVAVGDPLDMDGVDNLGHRLGLAIETVIAPDEDIGRAIKRIYDREEPAAIESAGDDTVTATTADEPIAVSSMEPGSDTEGDAPIIKRVHDLILDAIASRASDIHLEPLEKRFRVRYRIDGILVEQESPPKRLQLPMISRLKIMANMSIAEKRIPQDGRIQVPLDGRSLDLRVSSLPTAHGESIVMRVLDQENLQPGLAELGFSPDDEALVEQLITLPDGIILVTGPTGSGKTTTLYGCLHHLNRPDRKIITVEDPVEYQLSGINQVPVRHEIGMTFGSALRAMLRQAPNIIMVGEIRDLETAEIAINASLTGHMVFSTLHTNDAPGAIARLADIGVKPFLLSASLRAVVAQRLVRKVCPHCQQPHVPSASELRALGLQPGQAATAAFRRGTGCSACHGTGYLGRIGIFEIFVINEEIRQMIHEKAGSAPLRAKARALGMRTLREDGARKVIAGLTTMEEVVSITLADAGPSNLPHPP
jgi:general secretion pathway protein E/type IV pilus assembly protein PilB